MISIVDNIDGDLNKICFCKSCNSLKIMRNSRTKPMSEVTNQLDRVHIRIWGSSPNIFLEENHYMCIVADQVTGQVWTKFYPNIKELLQSI